MFGWDATPENLEVYLPIVRRIITGLVHGLRGKVHLSLYRFRVKSPDPEIEQSCQKQKLALNSSQPISTDILCSLPFHQDHNSVYCRYLSCTCRMNDGPITPQARWIHNETIISWRAW
ncbi:hypothetical protein BT96DRAFT_916742 [Gymnopus androsaceus JB14]|uniref:Uncharacterized protein n=1 Tax=Gymnopus androsaceus JB14 TaxID=1447944 RepID=A0A6A4I5E0_9AGAR|nr:hypothetical protein BT96DRAFT_916742 [Gymnopus androsaceus JB14]